MARTALVTGANRGIGFEAARLLARAGLAVVLTARDRDAGEAAADRLRGDGIDVRFEQLDVSSTESVEDCSRRLEDDDVDIDVLINNAGVLKSGGILDVNDDLVRETLEVNLLGPLRPARVFMPAMMQRGYGRVVNVSSGAGSVTEAGAYTPTYAISKAALNMLTRQLAFVAEGHGDLKVNAMCPGWVRTDMGTQAAPRSTEEGADTIVWLATLAADGPTNGFFRDRRPAAW
jgi:NAD(P)-dependent dehydrogenase (short-subunit alcohol dehydrogenase family)